MRSLGRDCVRTEAGQARALELLTLRSGVKGRAHKGAGGQELGQNRGSCQGSVSRRPERAWHGGALADRRGARGGLA